MTEVGLVAEDVYGLVPGVVSLDDRRRPETVSLSKLVPYLLLVIQSQESRILALEGAMA